MYGPSFLLKYRRDSLEDQREKINENYRRLKKREYFQHYESPSNRKIPRAYDSKNQMTSDSIQPIDSVERIHSKVTGRLYKGQGLAAPSASIPSKYQTLVTSNADKKGFQSQTKRFGDGYYLTENPGPGTYSNTHEPPEKLSSSFSKKGTGSFASKSTRVVRMGGVAANPGAGAYDLPSLLSTRHEFNKKNSRYFHHPIATVDDNIFIAPTAKHPAPNKYHVDTGPTDKKYVINAEAAFKSKTQRQIAQKTNTRVPSPSHYNIHDDVVRLSVKAPTSMFTSATRRSQFPAKPKDVPGPGAYKPFSPVDAPHKLIMPRKHYLCISAPAMPLPAPIPQPGPGTYELVNYEGPAKHYMSSAMFVSNSSRWTLDHLRDKDNPGPCSYKPARVGKQSFHFNAQNKWIPI